MNVSLLSSCVVVVSFGNSWVIRSTESQQLSTQPSTFMDDTLSAWNQWLLHLQALCSLNPCSFDFWLLGMNLFLYLTGEMGFLGDIRHAWRILWGTNSSEEQRNMASGRWDANCPLYKILKHHSKAKSKNSWSSRDILVWKEQRSDCQCIAVNTNKYWPFKGAMSIFSKQGKLLIAVLKKWLFGEWSKCCRPAFVVCVYTLPVL